MHPASRPQPRRCAPAGWVLVPTDTVYGLAARADDSAAVARLFELKRRPAELSIALIIADVDQGEALAALSEAERAVASRFWPGALTLVVERRAEVAAGLGRDDGTIALRVPDHDFLRSLARAVGPLATTSANVSGEPTPTQAFDAAASLAGDPDLVIDAGPSGGVASTVARIGRAGRVEVLRVGPIAHDALSDAIVAKEKRGKSR